MFRSKSPDSEVTGDRQRTPFDSLVSPPGSRQSPPSIGSSVLDANIASRCPLIHEDLMLEGNGGDSAVVTDARVVTRQSFSDGRRKEDTLQSMADDAVGKAGRVTEHLEVPVPRLLPPTRPTSMASRPLFSVHSSPQLLNEIFEECESDDEGGVDAGGKSHTFRQSAIVSPEVMRKFERLHKIRPSSSQRGTSCSSSDTSDTDDVEFGRTPNEVTKIKFRRRDSSEHSSDTDGAPSGPSSFSGASAGRGPSSSSGNQGQSSCRDKTDANQGKEKVTENHHGRTASHNARKENTTYSYVPVHETVALSNHVIPNGLGNRSTRSGDAGKKSLPGIVRNSTKKACENQLFICPTSKEARPDETKAVALRDKGNSQVINLRSRNFDDLVEKFGTGVESYCDDADENRRTEPVNIRCNRLPGTRPKAGTNDPMATRCAQLVRAQKTALGNQTWPRGRKISI